jgi:hypothetical protein
MHWYMYHSFEVLAVILLALVVEMVWFLWGVPWKRKLRTVFLLGSILAYPIYMIWVTGGIVLPVDKPASMRTPVPHEVMNCTFTYEYDFPMAGNRAFKHCDLNVFEQMY